MYILTPEPMSYKQQKKINESLVKLKIIKQYYGGHKMKEIARAYSCGRNTVGRIIKAFRTKISSEDRGKLLNEVMDRKQIEELMKPLKSKSTRPKSRHPLSASVAQEKRVTELFYKRGKIGPKRMQTYLQRCFGLKASTQKICTLDSSLSELTLSQLKGIYKRRDLKANKKKTKSGERRAIHDYSELSAFEYLYMDTKTITDQGALPEETYDKFKSNKDLPLYEWNILDAKSRMRFIAYSRRLSADLGYKYLFTTIMYIRGAINNKDKQIKVLTDNGKEFCGGSEEKEALWNSRLSYLNTSLETYNVGHDIRKNLIERSHKSDDEEFFVPRGPYIEDKETFLEEARSYQSYWNTERYHSGKGMENRTPLEVLQDCELFGARRLIKYPTLILEDNWSLLSQILGPLELKDEISQYKAQGELQSIDEATLRDIAVRISGINQNAPNVLTQYR